MIATRYRIINLIITTVLIYLLCGIQTSLWFQLSPHLPAPQLWLVVLLYLVLYRSYIYALSYSYFLAFIVQSFSSASIGFLFPLFFILVTPASYIKSRMFWPSTRYFVIATILFTSSYHFMSICLSYYLELNSTPLSLFSRLGEVFLTILVSPLIYWIMNLIDQLTLPDVVPTQGVHE